MTNVSQKKMIINAMVTAAKNALTREIPPAMQARQHFEDS